MPKEKKVYDFTKFHYEPIAKKDLTPIFERVKEKLVQAGHRESEAYLNIEKLYDQINVFYEHADKSSCGQIKANGYYSFVRLAFKYLQLLDRDLCPLDNQPESIEKAAQSLIIFSNLALTLLKIFKRIIDETNLEDEASLKALDEELLKRPESFRGLVYHKPIMLTRMTSDSFSINNNLIESDENSNLTSRTCGVQFKSFPLFSSNLDLICESMYEGIAQPNTADKEIVYRENFMFWIEEQFRKFLYLMTFIFPLTKCHLYEYPRLFFDSNFRAKVLNQMFSYPSINYTDVFNITESRFILWCIKYLTRHCEVKSDEIRVPVQKSIQINSCPVDKLKFHDVDKINFDSDQKIRCKYIRPENFDVEKCERLVLHLHGGGFMAQSCDSHEIFLKHWVDYNDIPVISVDYRVKYAFPVGLQDCFDVYVWLRTAPESEVRNLLGFYPKKIVINGDSAGGNLAFGINLILNDLRTEYKSQFNVPIQMPDGLVLIYTPFLVQFLVSPSRALSALDVLVPLGVQLVISTAIVGLEPNLRPSTGREVAKSILFPSTNPKPWFDCPVDQFNEKIIQFAKLQIPPYLDHLSYKGFDTLKDVPIHLICGEFDSFLDDSITLAKMYKGPLRIDVIPELGHAFLSLSFSSETCYEATMFCGQKIVEIFDQADLMEKNKKVV